MFSLFVTIFRKKILLILTLDIVFEHQILVILARVLNHFLVCNHVHPELHNMQCIHGQRNISY